MENILELNSRELKVFLAIQNLSAGQNEFITSYVKIGKRAGMCVNTIQKAVKVLETKGYITRETIEIYGVRNSKYTIMQVRRQEVQK